MEFISFFLGLASILVGIAAHSRLHKMSAHAKLISEIKDEIYRLQGFADRSLEVERQFNEMSSHWADFVLEQRLPPGVRALKATEIDGPSLAPIGELVSDKWAELVDAAKRKRNIVVSANDRDRAILAVDKRMATLEEFVVTIQTFLEEPNEDSYKMIRAQSRRLFPSGSVKKLSIFEEKKGL